MHRHRNTSPLAVLVLALVVMPITLVCHNAKCEPKSKAVPKTDSAISSPVEIESVTSKNQSGGLTAGVWNQQNYIYTYPLVKGPLLQNQMEIFTAGARLLRAFGIENITDQQIDEFIELTNAWYRATFAWLSEQMGGYASERFAFLGRDILPVTYNLPGTHADGYVKKWGIYRTALREYLNNLDQVMRDPAFYPGPTH